MRDGRFITAALLMRRWSGVLDLRISAAAERMEG